MLFRFSTAIAATLLWLSSTTNVSAFAPPVSTRTRSIQRQQNHLHHPHRQQQPQQLLLNLQLLRTHRQEATNNKSLRPSRIVVSLAASADDGGVMPLPSGSLVALVTPMKSDGSLDEDGLRELLRWHKDEGTDGVVILGTTGEASTLSVDEKEKVMSITKDEVGGILPIVVGTGTISTKATIEATQHAKANGADAALVVTPYYVKPSQAGLYQHFTTIADAVDLPLILYNVPGRTGVDLSVETTVKLSHHPMIKGLKDATGDNNRVGPMRQIIGEDFRLYSGEDGMAREYVLKGGDGVISVTANVAPHAVHNVMTSAKAQDAETAKKTDDPLSALHRDLFCEANPIPVKWSLFRMGKMQDGIRLPLTVLDMDFHDRLQAALSQADCIEAPPTSREDGVMQSYGWPSKRLLIQGQLFDAGLINEVLDIIEKRNGDFDIEEFSVQPNDQFSNADFNFKRPSSVTLKVMAVDVPSLDDIVGRLEALVQVMESAEGVLTVLPDAEEET